jgi:hypothetical protein
MLEDNATQAVALTIGGVTTLGVLTHQPKVRYAEPWR